MSLFVLKPIHWNSSQYLLPSGHRATSGFPYKHGYGHEEWNNSGHLLFSKGKDKFRAFHTEAVKGAARTENRGNTFVFMYASHHGKQELVGIAGSATHLLNENDDEEKRIELSKLINLKAIREEAWAEPLVREKYSDDKKKLSFEHSSLMKLGFQTGIVRIVIFYG